MTLRFMASEPGQTPQDAPNSQPQAPPPGSARGAPASPPPALRGQQHLGTQLCPQAHRPDFCPGQTLLPAHTSGSSEQAPPAGSRDPRGGPRQPGHLHLGPDSASRPQVWIPKSDTCSSRPDSWVPSAASCQPSLTQRTISWPRASGPCGRECPPPPGHRADGARHPVPGSHRLAQTLGPGS